MWKITIKKAKEIETVLVRACLVPISAKTEKFCIGQILAAMNISRGKCEVTYSNLLTGYYEFRMSGKKEDVESAIRFLEDQNKWAYILYNEKPFEIKRI